MPVVLDARTATDHFPGIGRYVVNLARALSAEGKLALLHDPTATDTRLALPDLPRVACAASPFSLRQQWQVPAVLRRTRATLYHSAYYLMPYWPGLPTVLTSYDLIPLIYPQYYTAAQRLIFRAAHRLALHTARVVLAISEATRADLIRFFRTDPAKIVVTPLAADDHFLPPPPERVAAARQKYGLPETYVLYFGSNKPHKNVARLVEAFGKIQDPRSKIQAALVIAGQWDSRYPEAKQIVEQASWQDRVKFIGPVAEADAPALYGGATLFVFPSEYEGFGLPVLEAMACGVPVVCSNMSSLPEVAGKAAVYFDPHNTEELGATLGRLLNNPAERSERKLLCLQQAAQFSWTTTGQRTQTAYHMALTQEQF